MPIIDPFVNVAFAVTGRPGAYALLLGSGVSTGAGLPTGWQVLQKLIGRAATVLGENLTDDEAPAWWERQFGSPPTYSSVMEQLARTPAERHAIVEGFISGDGLDEHPGPTTAHRATARLLRDSFVRVVLTTNFDRLLERACAEVGVELNVLASADSIAGALPLVHAGPVLVKLNGDQSDPRIRNTDAELDTYEPPIEGLLDRVFDEYGLIVCGWSGTSDAGIRSALLRATSRRFSTFWAARGDVPEASAAIVQQREAEVVNVTDADDFLGRLADVCESLATVNRQHPASVAAAAATAKRELGGGRVAISLHDTIRRAIDDVYASEVLARPVFDGGGVMLFERLAMLEADLEMLTALVAVSAYWGTGETDDWWFEEIARFAVHPRASGVSNLISLLNVPALTTMWAAGTAAIARGRWDLVVRLLVEPFVRDPFRGGEREVALFVTPAVMGVSDAFPRLWRHLRLAFEDHLGLGRPAFLAAWESWQYAVALFQWDSRVMNNYGQTFYPMLRVDSGAAFELRPPIETAYAQVLGRTGSHPLIERGMFGRNAARMTTAMYLFGRTYGDFAKERDWSLIPSGGGGVLPSGIHYPGLFHADPELYL